MSHNMGFPDWVLAGSTRREHDFVLHPLAQGLTQQQAAVLNSSYSVDPQSVYTIRQVHEQAVRIVRRGDVPQVGDLPLADGVVSKDPGVTLTVRTADCLPIFLCDPVKKCIGLVHAGWRGTAEKIVVKALEILEKNFGTRSTDVIAAIGPCIRVCCYEVGEEFRDIFPKEISKHKQKGSLHLDLPLVNVHQLMTYGVPASRIHDTHQCTCCNQQFYSYRRDQQASGRHLSFIQIRP